MSLEKSILKLTKIIQAVKRPITKPYTGRNLPAGCDCTQRFPDSNICVAIKCNDGTRCVLWWEYDVVEWRCNRI